MSAPSSKNRRRAPSREKISEIITGMADESLAAREGLLKWARRTTESYPGVKITDFTKSWRDGLALNAILHRNKPHLFEFNSLKDKSARDNLEHAFHLAENEFGITRLLDPEDVDTVEPDEKSLITYISLMFDVFPEPPKLHPFSSEDTNKKIQEYVELSKSLYSWMDYTLHNLKNQESCKSLIDMKSSLLDSSKLQSEEFPKRLKDKKRLLQLHIDMQKLCQKTGRTDFQKELQLEDLEKKWNFIQTTLQDHEQKIKDDINRLEKTQHLIEKFNKESKLCERKLNDVDKKMHEEEQLSKTNLTSDFKQKYDVIESELRQIEDILNKQQIILRTLEENKHPQLHDMMNRLENSNIKYNTLKTLLKKKWNLESTKHENDKEQQKPKQQNTSVQIKKNNQKQNSYTSEFKEQTIIKRTIVSQSEQNFQTNIENCQIILSESRESTPELVKIKVRNHSDTSKKMSKDENIEGKSAKKTDVQLSSTIVSLQNAVNELEKTLEGKLKTQFIWDLDNLEKLVLEHKRFDIKLSQYDEQITNVKELYKSLGKKSAAVKTKHDSLILAWNKCLSLSHLYIQKLKAVESCLHRYNEAIQTISNLEVHLTTCIIASPQINELQKEHVNLMLLQDEVQICQHSIDDLHDSMQKLKNLVQQVKSKLSFQLDVGRFETKLKKLTLRWEESRKQILERMRSCSASSELLRTYNTKMENDDTWISDANMKMNSLKTIQKLAFKEVEMVIEPAMDLYSAISEKYSSLEDTKHLGAMYIREAQAMVQANYQVCEDNTSKLETWMTDIEMKLSNIGAIREHLPDLQQQIIIVKIIKEELEKQRSIVTACLDQMRHLAQRGLEVLTKEQIKYLQKNLISLRVHFDSLKNNSDRILKHLLAACEVLQKYQLETTSFKEWINSAFKEFEKIKEENNCLNEFQNKLENIKFFTKDIIAHQADIRFISLVSQKFSQESEDYLKILNEVRENVSPKLSSVIQNKSEIKEEVIQLLNAFNNFLNEVNQRNDLYVLINSKYNSFYDSKEKAISWLKEIKMSSLSLIEELVSEDVTTVKNQLNKINLINAEVIGQERLIENVFNSSRGCIDALGNCSFTSSETKNIEDSVASIQDQYFKLKNLIESKIQEIQKVLAYSQDFQESLYRVKQWLNEKEVVMKHLKPASLIIDKLEVQIQELKILKSEIDIQKQAIDHLFSNSRDSYSDFNPNFSQKSDTELKGIMKRLQKVQENLQERQSLLEEILKKVNEFEESALQYDEWFASILNHIEGLELNQYNEIQDSPSVEMIMSQQNLKKVDFIRVIELGKRILAMKNISDESYMQNKISCLENRWKNAEDLLNKKSQLVKKHLNQLEFYESLRSKITDWLCESEERIKKLKSLCLDDKKMKSKKNQHQEMLTDFTAFSSSIQELNNVGNSIINEQNLNEKYYSQRNTNTDVVCKSLSSNIIKQQLNEINDHYSLLGEKISKQSQEMAALSTVLENFTKTMQVLTAFIKSNQKLLQKEFLPPSEKLIQNQLKILKNVQSEVLEKQIDIDNLKIEINKLFSEKYDHQFSTEFLAEHRTLENEWLLFTTTVKEKLSFLTDFCSLRESCDRLQFWLKQKEKMLLVLGPIASEPHIISSQVQQVEVMKDELTSRKCDIDNLKESSQQIIAYLEKNRANASNISSNINAIELTWDNIHQKLSHRESCLKSVTGFVTSFYTKLNELQKIFQEISDKIDKIEVKKYDSETELLKLRVIEDNLNKQRQMLNDVINISDQLCEALSDAASRNEIIYKVDALERIYTSLRKKIDFKIGEVQSIFDDRQTFQEDLNHIQKWLKETESFLASNSQVSANPKKNKIDIENFEVFYKQIVDKEHNIHLCFDRGTELSSKLSLKKDIVDRNASLKTLKSSFEKIKNYSLERRNTLQSALENLTKYEVLFDKINTWINSAEQKIGSLKSTSLKTEEINKQLGLSKNLKSEMSIYNEMFESVNKTGKDILHICDTDKEMISKGIEDLNTKWKDLDRHVTKQIHSFEELFELLSDYEEKFKHLQNKVQRLEDQFSSHSTLDEGVSELLVLDRLKILHREVVDLKSEFRNMTKFSKQVVEKFGKGSSSVEFQENIEHLQGRYNFLTSELGNKCATLEASCKATSIFGEKIKGIQNEYKYLEETFEKVSTTTVCDVTILKSQLKDIKVLKTNFQRASERCISLENSIKHQKMSSSNKSLINQMDNIKKQFQILEEQIIQKEMQIGSILSESEAFYANYSDTMKKLNSVLKRKEISETIDENMESLQLKKQELEELKTNVVLPLEKEVTHVNKLGQELINSVSITDDNKYVKEKLDTLNSLWNNLQENVIEKGKRLEKAVVESGKFLEALNAVQKWLVDVEEMVSFQKSPSSDFTVVKAQLQEQKCFEKMVLDQQDNVVALKNIKPKLENLKISSELKQTDSLIKRVNSRYNEILSHAEKRTTVLANTVPATQQFQDVFAHLSDWFETTEKKLCAMSSVAVEEDKIKVAVSQYKVLSSDIENEKKNIEHFRKISNELKTVLSSSETDSVNSKVVLVNEKYQEILRYNDKVRLIIEEAQKGMNAFSSSYIKLLSLIEKISVQLSNFEVLSMQHDRLLNQMQELKILKQKLDSAHNNLELFMKCGEEILKESSVESSTQIRQKMDTVTNKVSDVDHRLHEKIEIAEESLHLIETFYSAIKKLNAWFDAYENTFKSLGNSSLDAQSNIIKEIEKEITEYTSVLKTVNQTGSRLSQLSSGEKSTVFKSQMSRANQKFEKICEQIKKKVNQIDMLNKWKSQIMNEMDELLKYFQDAENKIKDDGYSFEPTELIDILNHLKEFDEEINVKISKSNEVIASSKKIIKELGSEDSSNLSEKIKILKICTNNISTLCQKKLRVLEQHLSLAQEFCETRTILGQWLDETEKEVECLEAHHGLNAMQIKKQQGKIREMFQSVLNHKAMLDKLNKIGNVLLRICKKEESNKIEVILKSYNNRYNSLHKILRERQNALEDALQTTAQKKPLTEAEQIQDEVERQVSKCTCVHRFKVYQVGEGKYRFGESEKLRLVRILRSTVMVRVGGGWMALDEFLVKNDPCRAKGRTNLELREQFVLAEGVSQSLAPFKSKSSPTASDASTDLSSSTPLAGPITKIREKTLPMSQNTSTRSSNGPSSSRKY